MKYCLINAFTCTIYYFNYRNININYKILDFKVDLVSFNNVGKFSHI